MSEQGTIVPHSSGDRPFRGAAWRGFLFGARVGAIAWCLLAIVGAIAYAAIAIVAWCKWGMPPEIPDGWFGLLRALGGMLASLAITAVYGAITGAAVMLAGAMLRRR
jgi:hypothetical protein